MNVADIMTMARLDSNTSSSLTWLSDAELIKDVNIIYHEIENRLVDEIYDNLFYTEFTTNLVASQYRYQLPTSNWWNTGLKKILEVWVKYKADQTNYEPVRQKRSSRVSWFDDSSRSAWDRFYDLVWEYIDIYPQPLENVTDWLFIKWVADLPDLTTTTGESDVFPWQPNLRQYHYLIVDWLKERIYRKKWETNEANNARVIFEDSMKKAIKRIKGRNQEPQQADYTTLYNHYGK